MTHYLEGRCPFWFLRTEDWQLCSEWHLQFPDSRSKQYFMIYSICSLQQFNQARRIVPIWQACQARLRDLLCQVTQSTHWAESKAWVFRGLSQFSFYYITMPGIWLRWHTCATPTPGTLWLPLCPTCPSDLFWQLRFTLAECSDMAVSTKGTKENHLNTLVPPNPLCHAFHSLRVKCPDHLHHLYSLSPSISLPQLCSLVVIYSYTMEWRVQTAEFMLCCAL